MPPVSKPKVFKTPDGKEFTSRAEWRDYMVQTFYSFKNKVNEPEPLIKTPGSIEGQMFDIADCENSTLVVMDHTEQVQIDMLKGCKVFLGACTSSIFIRNCEDCVFYTCCRQLRLREVVNCTFYIYSMAEVHIEYSNGLKFAPFQGGYPEHAKHLKDANLDTKHNMWFDIYDHNDPEKTRKNWALVNSSEYAAPWFPTGAPCEQAIPFTTAGQVLNSYQSDQSGATHGTGGGDMQSFSVQQLMVDANKAPAVPSPTKPSTNTAATNSDTTVPPPIPAPIAADAAPECSAPVAVEQPTLKISTSLEEAAMKRIGTPCKTTPRLPAASESVGVDSSVPHTTQSTMSPVPINVENQVHDKEKITDVLKLFVGFKAGEDLTSITSEGFTYVTSNGLPLTLAELTAAAPVASNELWTVEKIQVVGNMACTLFWATDGDSEGMEGGCCHYTVVLQRSTATPFEWAILQAQKSSARPIHEVPPPYYN